jgi:hypothetical protein
MLARYQKGCLQRIVRKDGVERWQFRWLRKGADGVSREHKKTIGPVKDYPEKSKKLQDVLARLRLNINNDGPTELTSITMKEAVEHYKRHELIDCGKDGQSIFDPESQNSGVGQMDCASLGVTRTASHQNCRC